MDPITVSLNQQRSGANLHLNCQSDGSVERWPGDKEEGDMETQKLWLGKLGCMLKAHQRIKCQWPHSCNGTNTNMSFLAEFNNPWKYALSNFPGGYKLFAVERRVREGSLPRKDYYLCGESLPSPASTTSLLTPSRWTSQIQIPTGILSSCALVT
jgi:hypothetical protein